MSKSRLGYEPEMIASIPYDIGRRWCRIARLTALLIVLVGGVTGCAGLNGAPPAQEGTVPDEYTGTVLDPPKELADFTLTSHTGAPLRLSDLRGRPVLLFFGYTHCPDVCPTTLGEWKRVKSTLGDDAGKVAFVFVGVDSKRDTPEALAQFVGKFDPSFTGLSGDEATLQAVGKDFGMYFTPHEDEHDHGDYLVDHSSTSYLIDGDGRLQKVYSYGVAADVISRDLQKLLAQG